MTEKIKKLMNDSAATRWTALILIALMMFFAYLFADILSPLKSTLELERGWDSATFGTFAGGEYFLNVFFFFLIFAGIILDKMGVRFTGVLSASLMVIGAVIEYIGVSAWFQNTAVMEWLNSWWTAFPGSAKMATLGFMIFGCGCEMAGTTVSKAIAKWFKDGPMALAMGLQLAIARLGTAFALVLAPKLVRQQADHVYTLAETARPALVGMGLMALGLILWALFVALDANADKRIGGEAVQSAKEDEFHFSDVLKVLGNKYFWLLGLLCVLFYSSIIAFKKFAGAILIPRFDIPAETAGWMVAMLPFSTVIFAPLFGLLVDKAGKGTRWMILGATLALIAHLLLAFAPAGVPFWGYLAMVFLGFGYSLVPAALWPSVPKIVPEKSLGTTFALIYWVQNLGLFSFKWLSGEILGSSAQNGPVRVETMFVILCIGALAVALLMRRTSARHPELRLDAPNRV